MRTPARGARARERAGQGRAQQQDPAKARATDQAVDHEEGAGIQDLRQGSSEELTQELRARASGPRARARGAAPTPGMAERGPGTRLARWSPAPARSQAARVARKRNLEGARKHRRSGVRNHSRGPWPQGQQDAQHTEADEAYAGGPDPTGRRARRSGTEVEAQQVRVAVGEEGLPPVAHLGERVNVSEETGEERVEQDDGRIE